jgi:hypothetical protein
MDAYVKSDMISNLYTVIPGCPRTLYICLKVFPTILIV